MTITPRIRRRLLRSVMLLTSGYFTDAEVIAERDRRATEEIRAEAMKRNANGYPATSPEELAAFRARKRKRGPWAHAVFASLKRK